MVHRASNDEFSVEYLFWFCQSWKADLKLVHITKIDLFWVDAPLLYLECAPNCKTGLQLKKIMITNIWQLPTMDYVRPGKVKGQWALKNPKSCPVFHHLLKVAFFQKVRFLFFFISKSQQKNIPKNYPELEIWICCLLWLAGNLNFKFRIVIWNIFFGDLKNTSHFLKKSHL